MGKFYYVSNLKCIDVDNIGYFDVRKWEMPSIKKLNINQEPVCYILLNRGVVEYVGFSNYIMDRIMAHKFEDVKRFNSILIFKPNMSYNIMSVEQALISVLSPAKNKKIDSLARYLSFLLKMKKTVLNNYFKERKNLVNKVIEWGNRLAFFEQENEFEINKDYKK